MGFGECDVEDRQAIDVAADGQAVGREQGGVQPDRLETGDPRLSLEERYGTHDGYVKAVTAAATALEKQGFLLATDVKAYVAEAEASNVLKPRNAAAK